MSDCIMWKKARNKGGYGIQRVNGRQELAHRIAWAHHFHSPIPKGKIIMHTCDNPACVNPEHLKPGTDKENMEDKTSKGREARGSRIGTSRLKEGQVQTIKVLLSIGLTQTEVAKKYNVSKKTISNIHLQRTWKHLSPGE